MNETCSGCGHKAVEGEMFTVTVNRNTEWWLTLFDLPQYCDNCRKLKEDKKKEE
uniref:Uncharacterized protein n=1 Tax=viral metagenome TaxID=1070528 RepID=A0A6M3LLP8_9ZZZZ